MVFILLTLPTISAAQSQLEKPHFLKTLQKSTTPVFIVRTLFWWMLLSTLSSLYGLSDFFYDLAEPYGMGNFERPFFSYVSVIFFFLAMILHNVLPIIYGLLMLGPLFALFAWYSELIWIPG